MRRLEIVSVGNMHIPSLYGIYVPWVILGHVEVQHGRVLRIAPFVDAVQVDINAGLFGICEQQLCSRLAITAQHHRLCSVIIDAVVVVAQCNVALAAVQEVDLVIDDEGHVLRLQGHHVADLLLHFLGTRGGGVTVHLTLRRRHE